MKTRFSLTRRVLALAAGAAAVSLSLPAAAQAPVFPQPGKPISIVIGFPAGGGIDTLARAMSQRLSEELGAPVVVENRPGAGATIAAGYVARAQPDGHTLLLSGPGALTIWPHLRKMPYDVGALTPIGVLVSMPFVLVTSPNGGPADVPAIIEAARKAPYPYASAGVGTVNQLSGEMFGLLGGFKVQEITYKGSAPALVDVMGGVVPIHFSDTSAYPLIESGKLRAMAVTTKKRSARLPSVPTMEEAGVKGYEVANWTALIGPPQMPPAVVAKIHRAVTTVLADPAVRGRIEGVGMDVDPGTPAEFAALLKAETQKFGGVVQGAGIKAE